MLPRLPHLMDLMVPGRVRGLTKTQDMDNETSKAHLPLDDLFEAEVSLTREDDAVRNTSSSLNMISPPTRTDWLRLSCFQGWEKA